MTTKRIQEAGTLQVDPTTKALRVCLISEGAGNSADFPREFFTSENGARLSRSLSFPAHPMDLEHPEHRDPLSAIARIGESVTVEEHEGKMGFWGEYNVSKTRPDLQTYLEEYGDALGLSVFSDSDGHNDPTTGKWVAESLTESDPFRSVDLVVAAGRGGKFEKVAESLGLLPTKTLAPAKEKEVTHMEKDIEDRFDGLESTVKTLSEALEGKAKAELQVQADEDAVNKAVESRLANYDKVSEAIKAAQLTETQAKPLMDRAAKGATLEELTPDIDGIKAIVVETLKLAGVDPASVEHKYVAEHLGGDNGQTDNQDFSLAVPGFGKVA